jgi:adenylate cyclase
MDHPHLKRRLKAILLADVVGYSRLMNADEAGTHVRVTNYTKDLIEPKIAEHGGRLIRTMGDGFLVEFDSAADAVACGLEIQKGLRTDDAGTGGDRRIRLRIGINTGDVIADDHDIYGNSVNIAARLEGLAEPGEVYVTRTVRDQLEGHPGLSFEDRGERRVKNIKTPVRVYRVRHAEAPPHFLIALARRFSPVRLRLSARGRVFSVAILATLVSVGVAGLPMWRDQSDLAPRASIVVLPFENFSGDPGETYFADAITDDLTTDVSRLPGTFVISRATAFTYKGKAVDVRQVGREWGVRYALEGSIRRVGTRVQTNAQLIDTASAAHIWADRFEYEISDLYALQQAITGRIAASLDIQLVRAEGQRAFERISVDPNAVDLRLRAMAYYINGVTPEHLLNARRLLEQSVQLDPNLAESWSWLAEMLVTQYLHRWDNVGKEALEQAEEAIAKAVAINPNVAQAYYTQGLIRRAKNDQLGALEALSRAVEVNPNFPRALAEKANQLTSLGRPAEAPPLVEKAIKLSPRDPALGGVYWIMGRAHFVSGDYRNAIVWLQKSVALRPNDWFNRLYLVSAYALDRQKDEAKKVLREFNDNPRFAGYSLQRVAEEMKVLPNDNPLIVSARQKVHEGLQIAGMAAH